MGYGIGTALAAEFKGLGRVPVVPALLAFRLERYL